MSSDLLPACGIDVGGTKIAGALVAPDGTVLAETRATSPAADPEAIQATVVEMTTSLVNGRELAGIGVGAAGYVDSTRSTVLFAPNLAWRDADLGADLAELIGRPVVVENDANAAAWGEFRFGAGRDVDNQLMITVGTGVGGGVIIDGNLVRGAFGIAGEFGHLCVVPDGLPCACGSHGCLEQYASGSALVRGTRAAAAENVASASDLIERAGGRPDAITGPLITDAAHAGDRFAVAQFAVLGRWLGHAIASLAAVLDPAVVVVGGGVSAAGDILLDPIRTTFEKELTGRGHRPQAEIKGAELGNSAGVIGVADLARLA